MSGCGLYENGQGRPRCRQSKPRSDARGVGPRSQAQLAEAIAEAMAIDRNGRPGKDPIDRRVVDIGRDEAGVGDERGIGTPPGAPDPG